MGAEHARNGGSGRVEIRTLLMSRRRCTHLHLLLLLLLSGLMRNQRRGRNRRLRVRPPRVAADEAGRAQCEQAIRVRDDRDERLRCGAGIKVRHGEVETGINRS